MGAAHGARVGSTAVVVSAGVDPALVSPRAFRAIAPADMVIAADGGYDRALALGLAVDVLVGDLDSIDPASLARARAAAITIEAHPADKDATDLELAIDAAITRGAERVVVLDGTHGRLDHLVGALLLLGAPRWAAVQLDAFVDESVIHVVHGGRGPRVIHGAAGDMVSLLALGDGAHGVRTEGLQYGLVGETLAVSSTRGVSNRFAGADARVELEAGTLLVVCPGPEAS